MPPVSSLNSVFLPIPGVSYLSKRQPEMPDISLANALDGQFEAPCVSGHMLPQFMSICILPQNGDEINSSGNPNSLEFNYEVN